MAAKKKAGKYTLVVPLDASAIEDREGDSEVRVLVAHGNEALESQAVKVSGRGTGEAKFSFGERPRTTRVVVGPADATDEELLGLQTVVVGLSPSQWADEVELRLPPVVISSYYWYWWLRWCRTFTVRGVVLCPDGSPVPGATVCANDVDWWWWWSSSQQVGCATTDASGAFEIKFRWCCGWWPWWWWRLRHWQLEPELADRVTNVLRQDPTLPPLASPSPEPSLDLFEQLVSEDGVGTGRYAGAVEAGRLDGLREDLISRLPASPELSQLRVWPWRPWHPWWDCTPDIIFDVTQDCGQGPVQIVSEGYADARWNIPQTLDVVLVASNEACCVPPPVGCDDEECLVPTRICDDLVETVGGNLGAPGGPAGYKNPGVVATHGDRPYGGRVSLWGTVECMEGIDYYEVEWTQTPAVPASWSKMPPAAAGSFGRSWVDVVTLATGTETFAASASLGPNVYPTIQRYEAITPGAWGNRLWTGNRNQLTNWLTENNFADGTYYLRVRGWNDGGGGVLVDQGVLPLCGEGANQPNHVVVTIDNRVVGSGPVDSAGNPCGVGTVHTCTDEPGTAIVGARLVREDGSTVPIEACGEVQVSETDFLEIDFLAHDPDGHLAYYTLDATYDTNLLVPLIRTGYPPTPALPGGDVLDSSPTASLTGPVGTQVGPRYGYTNPLRSALHQGAMSPHWHGGLFQFRVRAIDAFPETCCYQLELRAYKRTIHNCNDNYPHRNLSETSFAIVLP